MSQPPTSARTSWRFDAGMGVLMEIDLQVLGPLRLLIDGRAVELGPERRRTVLAALAVEPGRVVSVDLVADRVWDGEPPPGAAASVQAYVSRLRGSMRVFDADGTEVPPLLLTQTPGYRLVLPADALDANRFAGLVEQAHQAYASGATETLPQARTLVRSALAIWRDEPYLDIPAEFARSEATRLQGELLAAQELAVTIDLALGRHEAVLAEVTALAAQHPYRESLQAAVLLALYRSGRQAEALAHVDRIRDLLAEELGLDPGPVLRRLQEQILRQDPALDLPTSAPRQPTPAAPYPASEFAVVAGGRLIGRDRELARITTPLQTVGAALVAVAVVGEAGIGKTRLVEEAAAQQSRAGTRVAWGRCWQHEGAPLLWPWLQALEALVDQLSSPELAVARTVAGIGALLPRLAADASAVPTEPTGDSGPDAARLRLYEAVRLLLAALAQAGVRILLVLEDMHWADRASRELAEYLGGHQAPPPVGLVVTVRSPTEDSARVGTELLAAWSRSGRLQRVDLLGWSETAVADYVTDRTGDLLDSTTAAALTDRTGGNPFFVGELVRLLVTDIDETERGSTLTESVPDSVRDVIARRVERLPETDQTVLRVAAVVGRTFDLDLLEASAALDAETVDEAIDRATELGIIASETDQIGRHRFVHALTQQTLLDTTGPARRRRLHGRVAAALTVPRADAELTPAEAERLTYHLTRTGARTDLERAVDLTLAASDEALRHGNFPESESLLLGSLDLCGRLDGDGPRETATRVRLWSLYILIGGPATPEALGQHQRTMALIRQYGGTEEIMAGHQAMLARLSWFSDLTGIEQLVKEMSEAAEVADDDLLRAAAYSARAELLTNRGQLDDALAEFEMLAEYTTVMRTAPLGVFPLQLDARVAAWHAIALSAAGQPERADRLAVAAEQLLDGTLPTTAAYVRILLATRAVLLDDPTEALRLAGAAQSLAARHGLVDGGAFVGVQVAWAQERLDPGSGLGTMQEILSGLQLLPTMGHRPGLWSLLADGYLRAGREAEARTAIARARAEAAITGEALYLPRLDLLGAQLS